MLNVKTAPGYVSGCIAALIVVAILLSTRDAWRRRDGFHIWLRVFWFVALLVNAVAVLSASYNHIILQKELTDAIVTDWKPLLETDKLQLASIGIMIAFLTFAPMALSNISKRFFDDDENDDDDAPSKRTEPPPLGKSEEKKT